MTRLTIGMIGAGEMGAALARVFGEAGHQVLSDLRGRSEETHTRAQEAGIQAAHLLQVVAETDILFSVLPTQYAKEAAAEVADLIEQTGKTPIFVEANAISPRLTCEIAGLITNAGAVAIDAGLVGAPPSETTRPRLYACGGDLSTLRVLDQTGFDLVELSGGIGKASAFKMAYAAMTKGVNALLFNAMLAADAHDLLDTFLAEVEASQPQLAARARANIPRLPADAARWQDEMRQIAQSFEDIGLTSYFHHGAEAVMATISASPFGHETRRTRDKSRSLEATIKAIQPSFDKKGSAS
ncbi:NAD(P)-dependent oxidoreductase [uncultured Ruegeria sp.]|uniref:NAD(P)-dependent oxidoreductase n=1 Tax=uncultured Ruegeria sp. TaxID=259304 RepID=UPI002623F4BE|nr:NAD(P)-dependent oxidoreductase [uncultured Ruegeria sp.]